jgi:hypothetical protein
MEQLSKLTQQAIEYVDGTPNAGYPLRILRAYRENCNCKWSESVFPDLETIDPVLYAMNMHQEQRAKILDQAIQIIEGVKLRLLSDYEIDTMAQARINSIVWDDDGGRLSEKGKDKIREWLKEDFIAGAKAVRDRFHGEISISSTHKRIVMVYPGLNEEFHGRIIETEDNYVVYVDEKPAWADKS